MKRLRNLCIALALTLSHAMCAAVAYGYRSMKCGRDHAGFSAPAGTAFWYALPFGAGIVLFILLAYLFHRKFKKGTAFQK